MSDEIIGSRAETSSMEARLRLLEDRQAIHDDTIDNHFGLVLPFREAIGSLKSARSGSAGPASKTTSMHNLCNVLIDLDGDVARCESSGMIP